jgi:hypothetical protein
MLLIFSIMKQGFAYPGFSSRQAPRVHTPYLNGAFHFGSPIAVPSHRLMDLALQGFRAIDRLYSQQGKDLRKRTCGKKISGERIYDED